MKYKFKDIRCYQTRKGNIVLDLGSDLIFSLTKKQTEGFDLYGLEDFSQEAFIKYYDAKQKGDEKDGK